MEALRHGKFRLAALVAISALAIGIAGCEGDDGDDGPAGPAGADGAPGPQGDAGLACWDLNENGVKDLPDEDLNGDGVVDVNDCNPNTGGGPGIAIGDGSELTEEEIEELGQLVATIDDVEVSSPPVVTFTVTDNGQPARNDSAEVCIAVGDVPRSPVLQPIGNRQVDELEPVPDPGGTGGAQRLLIGAIHHPAFDRGIKLAQGIHGPLAGIDRQHILAAPHQLGTHRRTEATHADHGEAAAVLDQRRVGVRAVDQDGADRVVAEEEGVGAVLATRDRPVDAGRLRELVRM